MSYFPISATVRYECPNRHIWVMRSEFKPISATQGKWMTWRWAFCPECGMAAEIA
jgi:acetone carboxylase gamma subunit